jgi:hypothetical protein
VPHCGVEAAVAHAATFPARRAEYGPMLADLLDTGLALRGTDYQRLLLTRAEFTGRMNAVMQQVDLLVTPVIPFGVPTLGSWPSCARSPATACACRATRRPSTCPAIRLSPCPPVLRATSCRWACSSSPATCAKTCSCAPAGRFRTAPPGIPDARQFPEATPP